MPALLSVVAREALQLLVVITMAGMSGSFIWVVGRLISGRPLLPEREPPLATWGKMTVLTVLLSYLLIQLIAGALIFQSGHPTGGEEKNSLTRNRPTGGGSPEEVGSEPRSAVSPTMTEQLIAVTVVNFAILAIIPALVRWTSNARLSDLGLSIVNFRRNVAVGLVGFLVVTPWVYLTFALAQLALKATKHPLERMLRQEASPLATLLAVVSAVVAAPLAEELLFRGVIQTWLNRVFQRRPPSPESRACDTRLPCDSLGTPPSFPDAQTTPPEVTDSLDGHGELGSDLNTGHRVLAVDRKSRNTRETWASIGATSLMFAAVHYTEMPAPIAIFFLSLALGWVYQKTGSLVAPVVLHASFNALSTVQLLLALR